MTERSVQIWFQNRFGLLRSVKERLIADGRVCRRAKIKLLAKKSIETGEDCDAIPESMRQYLAVQAMESGKPLAREFLSRTSGTMNGYGNSGTLLTAESTNPGKVGEYYVTWEFVVCYVLKGLKLSTTSTVSP